MIQSAAPSMNEKAAEEYFDRATKAEQAGDEAKAVGFYERALNEDPDHEAACFRLAVLYDRRAEDVKAIDLYERLCAGDPVPINALVNLAVLYEDHGFYEEAAQCLRAVLDTDPNHARARLYLKDVESAESTTADDEDRRVERRNAVLDQSVHDFELSVRSRNALKKADINTLGDLLRVNEADLMGFKNFGETSLNEIKALLASKGYRLGQMADGGSDEPVAAPTAPATPAPAASGGGGTSAMDRLLGALASIPDDAGDAAGEAEGDELMERKVVDLDLSVRSRKALQRLDINTVGQLASRTEDELLGCKNFGITSLNEIKQVLGSMGVSLKRPER